MEPLPSTSDRRYAACEHVPRRTPATFLDPGRIYRYVACHHVPRRTPATFLDPETIRSFTTDSKVLPLFEKRTFDFTRMHHYSLDTNERLHCCWREFLGQLEGRQRTPFQFPSADDFHFYKYHTRYAPSQSLRNRVFKKKSFSFGSHVRGYAPVPNEMHTRITENIEKPQERPKPKLTAPPPPRRRPLKY